MSDQRLERIEDKLDVITAHLSKIDITLASQFATLVEHTRRSQANEDALATLKEELKPVFSTTLIVNFLGKLSLLVLGSSALLKAVLWVIAV